MASEETDKERADQINQIANGFGQTLLTICNGDWNLACSVCVSLLASTIAQTAINSGDDIGRLFDEFGEPVRVATLAYYTAFSVIAVEEEEGEEDGN